MAGLSEQHGKGHVMTRQPFINGGVVFVAIFFVGWSTGMGGSFLPNPLFSLLMGGFAAVCFALIKKFIGKEGGDI